MKLDDSEASLESLLRSVPLREPGANLDARVNATLASYRFQQSRRFQWRLQWHRLAIAAGILIALGIGARLSLHRSNPIAIDIPHPRVVAKASPIRLERDTSTVYDDGIIASTDDAAYQQYRRRTVREIWYLDPVTHAETKMTIPIEQIFIEKVDAF